jgi:hypothetical protein
MTSEDQIVKLLQTDILLKIQEAYGEEIIRDFKIFIERLRNLYRHIDLSQFSSVIAIYRHIEVGGGVKVLEDNVYQHCANKLVVNFLDDGYVEVCAETIDMSLISDDSFVYKWNPKARVTDVFIVKGTEIPYSDDPCANGLSYFAVKTYKDLDEALIFYRDSMALDAKGKALCEAMRQNRLFFRNAPEDLLQEALYEYLTATLREKAAVKREFTVDETHPVDISVSFKSTNHIALIEIKWVGKSLNESEDGFSNKYADSRANVGAKQLVDYIDANKESFPGKTTVGYLVVYDLRRKKNNNPAGKMITRKNGDYYSCKELKMKPDYKRIRKDYKETYRFFIKVHRDAYFD